MTDELAYLREAIRYAQRHSHDNSTKVGAVIVAGKKLVYGTNQMPALVAGEKADIMEHAERAAIYKAAACGVPTAGAKMYAPWFACPECARAIISAGIHEVVGLLAFRNATPDRWASRLELAYAMFDSAGVGTRFLSDEVGETILFDGKEFKC